MRTFSASPPETTRIVFGNHQLTVVLDADGAGPVRLAHCAPSPPAPGVDNPQALPLVEVQLGGEGRSGGSPAQRQLGGACGRRLRYAGHDETTVAGRRTLQVLQRDPDTGITVRSHLQLLDGAGALRAWAEVGNEGPGEAVLEQVSSFTYAGPARAGAGRWSEKLRLWIPYNGWCAENQWRAHTLPELGLADLGPDSSRRRIPVTSSGTWSTSGYLPMGCLENTASGETWLWQIEHNGPWHWEVGDLRGEVYVLAGGPTDREHQWRVRLRPGERFETVPVGVAVVHGGLEAAVAALTAHRRAIRRPNRDDETLPVVFNDFMNCLEGDPTTERVLALVDVAAAAGAEVFCVDAGWYADDGDWWDAVGAWEPSPRRFPGGLGAVLDRIRAAGMTPGLWLEPEVVGVRCPVAGELPEAAFFRRNGSRVTESGRHQLDFRHPAVVARMDGVVDRLVGELGVGYLKCDYNVDTGVGTEVDADSPGAGLLDHNRAYLAWLDRVLARHPGLVIENCAGGGLRMDYALLARLSIQSTSDQRDHRRYAAIAAAAPAAVTPEQGAVWAYPQPTFDDEELCFSVTNALLGRVHLSGRLDLLAARQLALVTDGITAYKRIRAHLAGAVPFWPLGLPGWADPWLALGMDTGEMAYLTVWRRGAGDTCELPLPRWRGHALAVDCLYPSGLPGSATWQPERGVLRVTLPATPSARLLRLRPAPPAGPAVPLDGDRGA